MLINGEQVRPNSVCHYNILSMVLMLAFSLKELLPWAIFRPDLCHPARRGIADWRHLFSGVSAPAAPRTRSLLVERISF
ncbi:hypothetical protein H4F52_15945 [Pectobacterium brasiliense]|uniref:hypothetical protein n=1 Tax=Pectobacterium brasiliense TaxID=180957 RepID=UPI00103F0CC2|nr:hypothetical protein [Pectobacterium brasiliense]MBN3133221.1 hypothetical protein [Pectobacterium brasiliense]